MAKNKRTTDIEHFQILNAKAVAHMLPLRNQAAARVFLFLIGVLLTPILIGIPILFLAFAKPKKYKNVRAGDCPTCKTPLAFQDSVTAFTCPECKSRAIIKQNKIKAV